MRPEVIIACLSTLVLLSFGCTIDLLPGIRRKNKNKHEADDTKMQYSDVVLIGKIAGPVYGLNLPLENYDGMYSVGFEVLCTVKGGSVPPFLYVAGMGKKEFKLIGSYLLNMLHNYI